MLRPLAHLLVRVLVRVRVQKRKSVQFSGEILLCSGDSLYELNTRTRSFLGTGFRPGDPSFV